MNKIIFNYAKTLLLKYREQNYLELKPTKSLLTLHDEYQFGKWSGNKIGFDTTDKEKLSILFIAEGYDLLSPYPEAKSRLDNSQARQRNEKHHALPVSQDFILVNGLSHLKLNGKLISPAPINSLGIYLNAKHIHSLEHQHIILVENLAVMSCLNLLKIPKAIEDALWLYRGDIKAQQQTGTAYAFFRRWQDSAKLLCFPDFDPEGLLIACSSMADYWLSPKQEDWQDMLGLPLDGPEMEWHKQSSAKQWLNQQTLILPASIKMAFKTMNTVQKTFKQEHIISHEIPLELHAINIPDSAYP